MYVGAIFFPLLGACIAGFFGRWLGDKASQWATVFFMALAAICGSLAFIDVALGSAPGVVPLFTFIDVGGFSVEWALRYDTLSVVMVAIRVTMTMNLLVVMVSANLVIVVSVAMTLLLLAIVVIA